MGIFMNEQAGTITIQTAHTTYQMKADADGTLLHTYYGEKTTEEDLSYNLYRMNRGFSGNPHTVAAYDRSYSLDTLPQEISCFGTGDYRVTALRVRNAAGDQALHLRYAGAEVIPGKYRLEGLPASYTDEESMAETLIVTLVDAESAVTAELLYGVFADSDVITRACRITNDSDEVKYLEKAGSMNLDLLTGDYDIIDFYGKWAKERQPERTPLRHGVQSIGSVRGSSSHHYNPSLILAGKDTTETRGEAYGFTFVYSGNFLIEAEKDSVNQTRIVVSVHPDEFTWELGPDASFETPEVLMTYSAAGFEKLSNDFHAFIRKHIVRGPWRDRRRPVLINNWEGTYFNFTGEKLLAIAKDAASLGVELFVLDDGWFGHRESDNSSLGDWVPNEAKLGMTMKELGERMNALGVKFGLWFEPETISEDSDLYRAHPDWAVRIPGRAPDLSRFELILDMSRRDVQDYIIDSMSALLSAAPIGYVKWDFNRSVCDKYSALLPAERQGEMAHRFVLGTYRVLETLLGKFPELLIEGCSGGGGRFDAGMLYYTPQIWCSDNTDAVERLYLQYGTSFIYPVSAMGAHVSAVPNHQVGRTTPMETRGMTAMSGTFGYELDVNRLTDAEKNEMKRQITVFRELYETLQHGSYFRLTAPTSETCTVWMQVAENREKAVVNAVYHQVRANHTPVYVKLRGLDPDMKYRLSLAEGHTVKKFSDVTGGFFETKPVLSGRALMTQGIYIPIYQKEYQSYQIILEKTEA